MVAGGFFRRSRVEEPARGEYVSDFLSMPNVDEFAFLPVIYGFWRQHELWDGTYTLDDLLDVVEVIAVRKAREVRTHG